jgi:light-regulated signal transduction histidine kinase (bacteriophytochrome)
MEAGEARAARELAEMRAGHVEELERKNRELESFSYSVSHDLRAPLRGIDGLSKMLLEDYGEVLDDQGKSYLGRVRSAAQRMAEIIDDLLQLARVSRLDLQRQRVDLSRQARSVLSELQRREPEREVEVVVQEGLVVDADERLMKIILENLLGNAWKFTKRAARARIEVSANEGDGETVFRVRDNGAGFDMAYADRLFRSFQRLHREADFPGTGIGLATVQRIIDRHGGRIWGEGAVDAGASFHFSVGRKAVSPR